MGNRDKQRIIDLQRQVRIARSALEKMTTTVDTVYQAHALAEDALEEMLRHDKPVPVAGLLGWEKRS